MAIQSLTTSNVGHNAVLDRVGTCFTAHGIATPDGRTAMKAQLDAAYAKVNELVAETNRLAAELGRRPFG